MSGHLARIASFALAAIVLVSCGASSTSAAPTATGSPGASASGAATPAGVQQMIGWLQGMAEECSGAAEDAGGHQRWSCTQDDAPGGLDRTVYRVWITADPAGSLEVVAVVDQTRDEAPDINRARGFLADAIAGSPATGLAGPALTDWVVASLHAGGRTAVGRIAIFLTPFGRTTEVRLTIPL